MRNELFASPVESACNSSDEASRGLILCTGKDDKTIRLLDLEKGNIRAAAYWTKLLPRVALARKLHQAVRHPRLSLDQSKA